MLIYSSYFLKVVMGLVKYVSAKTAISSSIYVRFVTAITHFICNTVTHTLYVTQTYKYIII